MRLRNVKNKEEILNNANNLLLDYHDYIGKWQELFKNDNPIDIEIGMGKGNFIIGMAKLNPDINYIGIEKFDSVIARATQKLEEPLPNLIFLRMNALEIDAAFTKIIRNIYLNFSDPWPKKRWAKRRLTSDVFLEKYDKIFKNKKTIIQKTDNRHLFEYSLESLSNYGYKLESVSLDLHKDEEKLVDNVMTEFEEKFVKAENPIYKLVATKE